MTSYVLQGSSKRLYDVFIQVTLLVALIPKICALVVVNTTDVFQYTYLEDYGINIRGEQEIIFMVKADNDAHLALSTTKGVSKQNSYEIVIGGWKNQRSAIRKCDQCQPKSNTFNSPLSSDEYRPFWIRWQDGLIQVGNGTVPLESEFMHWRDPDPHDINYIGVSTGWKSNGSWIFDFALPQWKAWGSWSHCDRTCNISIRLRMRNCTNQQPVYDIDCYGLEQESQLCDVPPCPIDGGWSKWGPWGTCSRSCGPGVQSRQRHCDSPEPKFGGELCPGDDIQRRRCDSGPCAVNGDWSLWTNWNECTVTCGGGKQQRTRQCNNPAPQFGGNNCTGNSEEIKTCGIDICPINGLWSTWTSWTQCTVTCGGGTQQKTRQCNNPAPQFGGNDCTGSSKETQSCKTDTCPINGVWSRWTSWTQCIVSCGGGIQQRTRQCNNPAPKFGGNDCSGSTKETQSCETHNCPVDGLWSMWISWTQCTVTCGGGKRQRTRQCNNPAPQFGGSNCTGSTKETQSCKTHNCPIDGIWSTWTNWTQCTVTCGGGTQQKTRQCNNPAPQFGGNDCTGSTKETQSCETHNCPIDGAWAPWQQWSDCSQTCGDGLQSRSRLCNNPKPQFGGSSCQGHEKEAISCNVTPCPINGDWSEWTKWSKCTTSCGSGSQVRTRDCNKPTPEFGGKTCEGNGEEFRTCSRNPCPVNGMWSDWSLWSDCSSSCGEGESFRERECTNPSPKYGGLPCIDNATESRICFDAECPIAGEWSSWSSWSTCSRHCGYGKQTRDRLCNNPAPQFGGDECRGLTKDERKCIERACPVDGLWGSWSAWTMCSSTCSFGARERSRNCSDPPPQFGGEPCEGIRFESQTCFDVECPRHGQWSEWTLWSSCTVTCNIGQRHRVRFCSHPSPRYGGDDCQGDNVFNQSCGFVDCSYEKPPKKVVFAPVEAPGAISIGMIGMSICGVLVSFLVILDLATIHKHIGFMKRNLAHYCGKYEACAPQPVKKRKKSKRYVAASVASTNSDENNVHINSEEALTNGVNHSSIDITFHENKALIGDDDDDRTKVVGQSNKENSSRHPESQEDRDQLQNDNGNSQVANATSEKHNNLNVSGQSKELQPKNIGNLYKRQIYNFNSTRL